MPEKYPAQNKQRHVDDYYPDTRIQPRYVFCHEVQDYRDTRNPARGDIVRVEKEGYAQRKYDAAEDNRGVSFYEF